MSVNININKMEYNGRSYAERAEAEKRKINRIISVREQSNELAHNLLKKTRTAKENELRKLQQIKQKELSEWKRRTQCNIQKEIDECIGNFGDAHIAAVNASCEEDESLREKRDEQDLMAAMRGRVAMLQVQRERERELENKLLKKKRSQQKTVGIQADFLAQQRFRESVINRNLEAEVSGEEEENEMYATRPNLHKHSEPYNPQNYTSHSIDSSNNNDSDVESVAELEQDESSRGSDVEFNQISNLLKHRLHKNDEPEDIIEIQSESSDTDSIVLYKTDVPKRVTIKQTSPKKRKGILKKSPAKTKAKKPSSPVKSRKEVPVVENRVRYVDFGNKYETTYVPDKNLIVRNEKTKTNARQNAQIQTDDDLISKKINEDILKQLTDLRSQEALEKEKIRRDYDRLRFELDELSKQEQEAKAKTNAYTNLSRDQLLRKEDTRQKKMNEAAENLMKRNIITCPPVDRNEKLPRQKSNEINVAAPSQYNSNISEKSKSRGSNSEINNLVKIEKLKDLLEKINHQKRLLLNEIEKSDDVPGPDLEKVMDCIKKLEQEKATFSSDNQIDEAQIKKVEELKERERKVQEREKRLENKLRDMFRKQQENVIKSSSSSSSEPIQSDEASSTQSDNKNAKKIVQPPVEIIIKVQQPKSPRKKTRKSYKFVDTLSREPGKVYPKTPIKRKRSLESDVEPQEVDKSQQQTQTSPVLSDAPKPILKNSQIKQISIPPKVTKSAATTSSAQQQHTQQPKPADPEDFSVSTVYRELPPQINLAQKQSLQPEKSQRKLNPLLLDYITRLLGMGSNIGNQLNVDVSSITTPGSSTINTSENISSSATISFDNDRMDRLQKFIDDNHSFISEINESLEKVETQKKQDHENKERMVEGIWREILRRKKPSATQSKASSNKNIRKASSAAPSVQSSKKINQPKIPQAEPKKKVIPTGSQTAQTPKITQEDMSDVSKQVDSRILDNFSEYTANCEKRISKLTQMMEQVRQEKMRLIENSLSSNEFNNFTEYKEIAQTTGASNKDNVTNLQPSNSTDPKDSPSNRDDPPSEEINNILQYQTRPFGVSKDSGISVSRPVTSSDFRDSPDVRVTSEENNNLFQPINKDLPKVPRMKITAVDGETQTIKDVSALIKNQQDEKAQKKQKPPLSLKSPQFEKQQHEPHELSTIVEIETPTASKVNLIQDEISALHSFPNFEEYAKRNDVVQMEVSQVTEKSQFPDLNDLKKALPDINIKTFVGQDNFSIADLSKDVPHEENDNASNASSLMDIMEELKRRDLIQESFEIYYESDNNDNNVEGAFERDDKTTPTATNHLLVDPTSPKRKPAQSRIIKKTPENLEIIEAAKTPTKKRDFHKQIEQHEPQSPTSNDTLSGIQEIEKDFQGMGWAASTLKRTEESNKKHESSSSSSDKQGSIKVDLQFDVSSSSSDGKPLNLRDFLRRELLTRSRNDPYLSDDSSLSARFLKSLLKASNDSSTSSSSNNPRSESSQNAKLRTSTPVRMSSENLIKTAASSQMFVGADSVSTVKDSDSSKDKSEKSKSL